MRRKTTRHTVRTALIAAMALMGTACETTDCPLNNIVYSTYGFYAIMEEGETQVSLLDTLTITDGERQRGGTPRQLQRGGGHPHLPLHRLGEPDTPGHDMD